jgi:hypothetical protein
LTSSAQLMQQQTTLLAKRHEMTNARNLDTRDIFWLIVEKEPAARSLEELKHVREIRLAGYKVEACRVFGDEPTFVFDDGDHLRFLEVRFWHSSPGVLSWSVRHIPRFLEGPSSERAIQECILDCHRALIDWHTQSRDDIK